MWNRLLGVQKRTRVTLSPSQKRKPQGKLRGIEQLENRELMAASILVSPARGLTTSEAAGAAVISVVLRQAPASDVIILISSSKPAEGLPDKSQLVFTPADWNVVQKVRVTGQADCVLDANKSYRLVTGPAVSADPAYNGLNAIDPQLRNLNSRKLVTGVIVTPVTGLTTSEAGKTASFNFRLQCISTADSRLLNGRFSWIRSELPLLQSV